MSYDKERFFDDVIEVRRRQPFSTESAAAIVEAVWPKVEDAIDEAVSEALAFAEIAEYDELSKTTSPGPDFNTARTNPTAGEPTTWDEEVALRDDG